MIHCTGTVRVPSLWYTTVQVLVHTTGSTNPQKLKKLMQNYDSKLQFRVMSIYRLVQNRMAQFCSGCGQKCGDRRGVLHVLRYKSTAGPAGRASRRHELLASVQVVRQGRERQAHCGRGSGRSDSGGWRRAYERAGGPHVCGLL